jgi:phage repressor protein C with HTH and peptisase S24 domain
MFRSDRLAALMEERGISQAALAREVGVSQTAIWKLVSGKGAAQGSKHIHKIARALGTSPEYLMDETDDAAPLEGVSEPRLGFKGAAFQPKPDTVDLQEFDLAYGLGSSFIHDMPVTGEARTFSRGWLRHFTESPFDKLFWARGIGDSMTPTIQDADVVLIDTAQRTPRIWDKLWAVEMGGMGMIKRLRPTKDASGMRLLSDAGQPEETAYDGEMNVIGRVVAIVRKV